jgi:Na+-driven multidrug efflux pump
MKEIDSNKNESKENFCGACVAIPLAFAGVGASAYGANSKDSYKKRKKYMLWGGVLTIVISLIIAIIYMSTCNNCR